MTLGEKLLSVIGLCLLITPIVILLIDLIASKILNYRINRRRGKEIKKMNQNKQNEQNKKSVFDVLQDCVKDFEKNPALSMAVGALIEDTKKMKSKIQLLEERVDVLEQCQEEVTQADDDINDDEDVQCELPKDVVDLLKADVACSLNDCGSCPYYVGHCSKILVFEAKHLLDKYGCK